MKKSLENILINTKYLEDDKTLALMELSQSFRNRGYLLKDEALEILHWKSPRPKKHYSKNSEERFKNISKLSFSQKDDRVKIHILTCLNGINYPSASAILMFLDPNSFPVLDIRVWEVLFEFGLVNSNPSGRNFNLDHWEKYIEIIRSYGEKLNDSVRSIEKRIFDYHKMTSSGRLYG